MYQVLWFNSNVAVVWIALIEIVRCGIIVDNVDESYTIDRGRQFIHRYSR